MNSVESQLVDTPGAQEASTPAAPIRSQHIANIVYAVAIAAAVSIWLLPIRAPLGLDESGSFWQISAGVSQIWPRQFQSLSFPAYSYILWFFTKLLGTSEIALRIPSVVAMLGAAWLLYCAARELFERDIALLATLVFCLHPIVVYESIDARPYSFATLATNAAILVLLRLRASNSLWLAALFGLLSAFVVYFHHLFATILPVFLLSFIAFKFRDGIRGWKQVGIALAAFCIAFLPLIPGLGYLVRSANSHVYEAAPRAEQIGRTLAPGWTVPVFVLVLLLSSAKVRASKHRAASPWTALVCVSLALIPVLVLFGVSSGTSIHTFAARHRLAAVPGIALTWALCVSWIRWRPARHLFCAGVALMAVGTVALFPSQRRHIQTWKFALQAAEKSASVDHAPVLMCSPFIESDYSSMNVADPNQSIVFAPLTYYELSSPVIPLPRDITTETIRVGSEFLKTAVRQKQRFLVVARTGNPVDPTLSYPTVQWIEQSTSETYAPKWLGIFDQVAVVEFVPLTGAASSPR